MKRIFLIIFIFCGIVNATTYYVATDGNDTTGDGSSGTPYQTITKAWSVSSSGDTIELADGNYPYIWLAGSAYTGDDSTPAVDVNDMITIKATNPLSAIIDYNSVKTPNRCCTLGGRETIGGNYDRYAVNVNFEDIKFNGMIYINTAIGIRFSNCDIYGFTGDYTSDPNSFKTIVNALQCDVTYYTSWENGILMRASSSPVRECKDITVDNCRIYNHLKGISATGVNITVNDTDVYSFGTFGITVGDGNGITVSDCNVHHSIQVNEGCTDYDQTHTNGIYFGGEPIDCTISGTKLWNLVNQGIFVPDYNNGYIVNPVIVNNLIYDVDATSMNLCRISGGMIANNTCLGTITIYAGSNSPNYDATGIYCFNNIFGQYNVKDFASASEPFAYNNYNIYQARINVGSYKTVGAVEPNSLAITNYDASEPLTDYTMFTDSNNSDFSLAINAAAIDFGITSFSAPTTDLLGNTRDSLPDAGAYEYSQAATAPDAPTALTATATSSSQIDLSWTDNSTNETGFKVERAADDGGSPGTYSQIGTTASSITSYSDTVLAASTKYHYRVRAYNAVGNSAYSNDANDTTLVLVTPPASIDSNLVEYLAPLDLGDRPFGSVITHKWRSNITAGTLKVYKGTNAVPYTTITDIRGFGDMSGVNVWQLNTNNTFFETGQDYAVIIVDANSSGNIVSLVTAEFSIENRLSPNVNITDVETQIQLVKDKIDNVSTNIDSIPTKDGLTR